MVFVVVVRFYGKSSSRLGSNRNARAPSTLGDTRFPFAVFSAHVRVTRVSRGKTWLTGLVRRALAAVQWRLVANVKTALAVPKVRVGAVARRPTDSIAARVLLGVSFGFGTSRVCEMFRRFFCTDYTFTPVAET